MRHARLKGRFGSAAYWRRGILPGAAWILVLALVVALVGSLATSRTFGSLCQSSDHEWTAASAGQSLTDHEGTGQPVGHSDSSRCCMFCESSRRDASGLAAILPLDGPSLPPLAQSIMAPVFEGDDRTRPPLGFASSWSSRAPPLLIV